MIRIFSSSIVAIICLLPHVSAAQAPPPPPPAAPTPAAPRGGSPGVTIRQDPPRPASRPARPPGAPLVPLAPPSALDSVDLFRASPRTYAPRFDRRSRRNQFYGYGAGYGYITDPFGYVTQPYDSSRERADDFLRGREEESAGYLRLEVTPETAQVYVDGLYSGTVADFRGGGRALDAGPHRIDLRADGFDPLSVQVRVRPDDTLSYRGSLRPEQRAELRVATAPPKTMYVIPRCYAGDSRPTQDELPKGCRIGDVRIIPPVVNSARPTR
jgi:hypothetical protein